ncbi:hypothetical protein PMN64_26965 [Bradyrhizobium sp. UFLA01-814]|uniref:hypothetical protein n=1 Tax=Bradyrhizobium sp. UFLA01-814 TaxID=3023480 RepID=UPI00398B4E37
MQHLFPCIRRLACGLWRRDRGEFRRRSDHSDDDVARRCRAAALRILVMLLPSAAVFIITCLLTAIPTAIVVWFTEEFHIRAVGFFACAGAAIGALSITVLLRSPAVWTSGLVCLFVVAGFVAGLTYWFVMCELAAGQD